MYCTLKINEKKLVKVKFAKSSFEFIFRKKKFNKILILMDRNLSNQLSVAEALAGC